ncbi:hypothetical protein [Planococcus lenghuensis]|uniref:Sodium/calcium exchanger membrane region domain-containing protein n=1 Tax=Planococcus lenghuensis TaxID=2213202 RepID=A0A1Q2KYT8_9BACL|nr:hypothetical protein [Planococcus lenghuensis]AQQ53264.1 hypothetical protein B0X71_09350 [Planococcus lenghuensis]
MKDCTRISAVWFQKVTHKARKNKEDVCSSYFLIAVTTSLPEAISVLVALRLNNANVALSSILGSDIFNMVILTVANLFTCKPCSCSCIRNASYHCDWCNCHVLTRIVNVAQKKDIFCLEVCTSGSSDSAGILHGFLFEFHLLKNTG